MYCSIYNIPLILSSRIEFLSMISINLLLDVVFREPSGLAKFSETGHNECYRADFKSMAFFSFDNVTRRLPRILQLMSRDSSVALFLTSTF